MSAILSDDLVYRYRLERCVADAGPVYAYFGGNPSTADHEIDDQTVKKWRGFTKLLGGSRFIVGNVLSFRATDVRALSKAHDPLRTRERRTYSRDHRGDGGLQVRERAATDPAGGRGPAGAIPETALSDRELDLVRSPLATTRAHATADAPRS